ncbi:MAG: hypothetical protein R2793_07085 [Flavobacteriaceae bacterium]
MQQWLMQEDLKQHNQMKPLNYGIYYIFNFIIQGFSRNQYADLLTNCIGRKYEKKNDPDIYNLLNSLENSSEEDAIRNAENLIQHSIHLPDSQSNPVTYVHKLVEELNKFK